MTEIEIEIEQQANIFVSKMSSLFLGGEHGQKKSFTISQLK